MTYHSIQWIDNRAVMIDQRLLPHELKYVACQSAPEVAEAIRDMTIRGAPAIGAAAGYGLALAALGSRAATVDGVLAELEEAARVLKAARPTAVNLFWAVDRVMGRAKTCPASRPAELAQAVLDEADAIAREDIEMCRRIGQNALAVIPQKATFIHHCNTGALATVGIGSALGAIRTAHEAGREVFVYVDETRPRLQGARLTAWELQQLGIPHAVIADGASGWVMKNKGVDLCVVGCDRIAANGDVANKIGTYNLALVAKAHGVPFYSVGPVSTVDLDTPTGEQIEIEERDGSEVTRIGGEQIAPEGTRAVNPAFDVTPHELITGIITDRGIVSPPFEENLRKLLRNT